LVFALLKNGQIADALREAEAAMQLWSDDPLTIDLLGLAFTGAGQLDAASDAFERALQLAPDFEQAREHLQLLQRDRIPTQAARQ
jgi:Flp pilus assembly protein TadD